jgi:hypothetical protein
MNFDVDLHYQVFKDRQPLLAKTLSQSLQNELQPSYRLLTDKSTLFMANAVVLIATA